MEEKNWYHGQLNVTTKKRWREPCCFVSLRSVSFRVKQNHQDYNRDSGEVRAIDELWVNPLLTLPAYETRAETKRTQQEMKAKETWKTAQFRHSPPLTPPEQQWETLLTQDV